MEVGAVPVADAVPATSVPLLLMVKTETDPEDLFAEYKNFPSFDTLSESGALPVEKVPAIFLSAPVVAVIL